MGRQLRFEARDLRPPAVGDFERELLEQHLGPGRVDRHLNRLRRAEERIRGIEQEAERAIQQGAGAEEYGEVVRQFYGRLASFVREVEPDLLGLRAARGYLRRRPHLDIDLPRLVVAGFPNVGKSSLVACLSSARPKVAEYPFTTMAIAVGHADLGFDRLQVVDTPGVLGRRGRANAAEVEAETTVRRVASVVLFVLDPSGSSGYPLDEQEALLARWREEFPDLDILPVETKSDLERRPSDRLQVSAKTGEGLEALWLELRRRLRPRGPMPAMQEALEEEPPAPPEPVEPRARRSRRPK